MGKGRKYSKEHEWVEETGLGTFRIGISGFAQAELGDIVFVELPEVGTEVQAGDSLGTIESVKTVSDLFAPVSGKVVQVNSLLLDQPELVNQEPQDGGWMVELEPSAGAGEEMRALLDEAEYQAYIGEQ